MGYEIISNIERTVSRTYIRGFSSLSVSRFPIFNTSTMVSLNRYELDKRHTKDGVPHNLSKHSMFACEFRCSIKRDKELGSIGVATSIVCHSQ